MPEFVPFCLSAFIKTSNSRLAENRLFILRVFLVCPILVVLCGTAESSDLCPWIRTALYHSTNANLSFCPYYWPVSHCSLEKRASGIFKGKVKMYKETWEMHERAMLTAYVFVFNQSGGWLVTVGGMRGCQRGLLCRFGVCTNRNLNHLRY